jgi:hypothetical protein
LRMKGPGMQSELTYVERMLDEDVHFGDIELYIDTCAHLSEETRSALWLVAWTQTNRHERRRAVGQLIAGSGYDLGREN